MINWEGYVIRVEDNRKSVYKLVAHAVQVLVRMEPPELDMVPDVMLTIDSDQADKYAEVIEKLDRGGKISFNATFKGIGDESRVRHFHLYQIQSIPGYLEI